LLLLFGQRERLFDWWALLISFSGNGGAKFSKKIRFLKLGQFAMADSSCSEPAGRKERFARAS